MLLKTLLHHAFKNRREGRREEEKKGDESKNLTLTMD